MNNFNDGIKLPTLIKQLKKILEEYPDDGQILKELIQNAEDAGVSGATQIKFLIDYSSYGTETVVRPGLEDFQGPALYVYNDALFTEEDWDGIRSLQESIKENNPLKVGRFGLGFKSVFHMTDLPSIFSNKGIGFIDPHVRYFERKVEGKAYTEKTSCFLFNLEDDHDVIKDKFDQFSPFCQEVFGITKDKILKEKQFNGTLFRFPFRNAANKGDSKISETVYDRNKIQLLIQILITDSHNTLLFLKNLERIEVYEKSDSGDVILKFKLEISDSCRDWVREKRQKFVQQLGEGKTWTQRNSAVITYPIAFDITNHFSDKKTVEETWWIVTQYFAGEEDAQQGDMKQDNRYLPLVGIAQKINFNKIGSANVYRVAPNGHIFCFLPLPIDPESPTGFRVHVNGAFAVDHSRRHLKWPTDRQNLDNDLNWNLFLAEVLIPKAFTAQLNYMVTIGTRFCGTKIEKVKISNSLSPNSFIDALKKEDPVFLSQHIYALIPEEATVRPQWASVVEQVGQELANIDMFYTVTRKGRYINYQGAIIDVVDERKSDEEKGLDKLLNKILIEDNQNVVNLPDHVCKLLPGDVVLVSPSLVVESLKSVQDNLGIDDEDKIKILDYCFLDCNQIPDLTGVKLLPLEDGTWTTFNSQPDEDLLVYFESYQHRQNLLPGLERMFLRQDGVSPHTLAMLKEEGIYQLRELNAAAVAEHLPEVFNPDVWPSEACNFIIPHKQCPWFDLPWLNMIWEYLNKHHTGKLNSFENLPIIPLTKDTVTRLCLAGAIVAKSTIGSSERLNKDKVKLCTCLGIKVMEVEDSALLQNKCIWMDYMQKPNDIGITKAILRIFYEKNVCDRVDNLDENGRNVLKAILVEPVRTLSMEEVNIIKSLKLFKGISGTNQPESSYVSILDADIALPRDMQVIQLPCNVKVLYLFDDTSIKLAKYLGVSVPTKAKFIKQVYMAHVQSKDCPLEDRKTLILYLLQNWQEMANSDYTECCGLAEMISTIPFITTTNGSRVRPIDVYDSSINRLKVLFSDFDVFAGDEFDAEKYSDTMKIFGMKHEDSIENEEILEIAERISTNDNSSKRSEEFMSFINSVMYQSFGRVHKLDMSYLKTELSTIRWVKIASERQDNYPRDLLYASENNKFASPNEVSSSQFVNLIGSVQPIVQTTNLANLAKVFGWQSNPSVELIAKHLCNVVESFSMEEQTSIQNIVKSIYQHLQNNIREIQRFLECIEDRPWIWNGEGFSRVDQMVYSTVLDLRPHCYRLPLELNRYTELWKATNVQKECQLNSILEKIKTYHDGKKTGSEESIKRDINLCIQILDVIALERSIPETVLIPIHTNDGEFQMREKKDCAYCDAKWFKSGMNVKDKKQNVYLVHESISLKLCSKLKIDSLVSKTIGAQSLNITCGYGQSEKLTTRLSDILRGYNDGLAVFKELIQNADDAGANEIHFLYDERENDDARDILLDPGMAELQGPALWTYNDALFSEKDFENITKIGAASKEHDTGKIGRFGVGFNVVYNLTDVPIFISNKYIAILDPHTKYLGNMISDKSQPGILLNMETHRKEIQTVSHQFKPFDQIFDCDFSSTSDMSEYPGTLFRLPLRTPKQAQESEICKRPYDKEEVMKLIGLLSKAGHQLFLHTQNLTKISVSHLDHKASPPNGTEHWFTIEKNIDQIIPNSNPNTSVLKQASNVIENIRARSKSSGSISTVFEVSVLLKITTDYSGSVPKDLAESEMTSYWLVVSCLGREKCLTLSLKSDRRLIPVGGAAAKLKITDNSFQPVSVSDGQRTGMIFCFMPLPISTTFPVHINGYFEVYSNRTHIYETVANDKDSERGLWNQALLQDAVARAYVLLLENLTSLCGSRSCYQLWPSHRSLDEIGFLSNLTEAFYKTVCSESTQQSPRIFKHDSGWAKFFECRILEASFRKEYIAETILSVLKSLYTICESNNKAIDFPVGIQKTILMTSSKKHLSKQLVSKQSFFELFLQHVNSISPTERDKILIYALLDKDILVSMANSPCIPVTPDGIILKKPCEVIDPRSKLSVLYDPDEGRFPYFNHEDFIARQEDLYNSLNKIGMQNHDLPWQEICDRLQRIADTPVIATKQTPIIVSLMEKKLEKNDKPDAGTINLIQDINFVQPARKPAKYLLKWKGDEPDNAQLTSINKAYLKCHENLVSCSCYIIDESAVFGGALCKLTKQMLGLGNKEIPVEIVEAQLLEISKLSDETGCINHLKASKDVFSVYEACFTLLNKRILDKLESSTQLTKLKETNIVLVETNGYLLKPYQCALSTDGDLNSLLPYLGTISKVAASKYGEIYRYIGVKEKFNVNNFQNVLETIYNETSGKPLNDTQLRSVITDNETSGKPLNDTQLRSVITDNETSGKPLDDTQLRSVITAISCICRLSENSFDADAVKTRNDIYVPNIKGILSGKDKLCYNSSSSWLEDQRDNYCHTEIPPKWAQILGIRPLQQELMREQIIESFKFGQREELITRINRLLDGYLCDVTILKELLQNADDSGATQIQFILDTRQLPQEKVFQDSWKLLQGPSLCVYNNKSFKKSDIEGIQKLGEGSKSDDTTKTGQFGVGYNCVYNLTDVPSFVTNVKDTGTVLCVFDPNCKYAPEANENRPGGMYHISTVREKFPDVFQGYLQDFREYDIANEGTMFRFPLRTFEMLQSTTIKGKEIKVNTIKEMFKSFMSDMYEMLLFVHNVRSISVKEISGVVGGKGQITTLYTVESKLSATAQDMMLEFEKFAIDSARKVRPRNDKRKADMAINQIECKEIIYEMETSDSNKKSDTWQIVQRFGFHEDFAIPPNVSEMMQIGELKLLPRGGVAYLKNKHSSLTSADKSMRYFCYLPLPVYVKLPVHINGHFALNSETRRGIWTDVSVPLKVQWNVSLMEGIIAPAYCSLIGKLNSELRESQNGSKEDNKDKIKEYLKIFPTVPAEPTVMLSELTQTVYATLFKCNMPLLPLLSGAKKASETKWCCPRGTIDGVPAYFDDLNIQIPDDKPMTAFAFRSIGTVKSSNPQGQSETSGPPKSRVVQQTLSRCGMYLFPSQMDIYENFVKAKQNVLKISPDAVLQFLNKCSYGDEGNFPYLPASIEKTPLKDLNSLIELLKYCAKDESYKDKLQGLPLLVTYDNMVQFFDETCTKYSCDYGDIAVHVPGQFILPDVSNALKLDSTKDFNLCKHFDINEFLLVLSKTLPEDQFFGHNRKIPLALLSDIMKTTPNWLKTVFKFLYHESKLYQLAMCTKADEKAVRENETVALIEIIKQALRDWCLLPVFFNGSEMLFTFGQAESVLQPLALNVILSKLFTILQEFGCPVIMYDKVDVYGTNLSLRIVGSAEKPIAVAMALNELQKVNTNVFSGKKLFEYSEEVLKYFSTDLVKDVIPKISHLLIQLPFFETIYNKLVSPAESNAFVLPHDIPKDGMEKWTSSLGVTFLKEKTSTEKLYELLGFKKLSLTEVYCMHVFKKFSLLNEKEKQVHLSCIKRHLARKRSDIHYLATRIETAKKATKEELQNNLRLLNLALELLSQNLNTLQFIPCPDSKDAYEAANCFFDHSNDVFSVMESKFLPAPYNEEQWIDFMKECGLVHEVSQESFVKYAKSLESQTVTEKVMKKSNVLLNAFLRRSDLDDNFLDLVKDITFITPFKASDSLVSLHSQIQGGPTDLISFSNSTFSDYCEMVWTAQSLLPLRSGDFLLYEKENKRKHVCQGLQIHMEPACNSVARHAQLLCNHLASENKKALMDATISQSFERVLSTVYEFLNAMKPLERKIARILKPLPFILIPDSLHLVQADQIVIDMSSSEEIKPYLHKIPLEFGKFKDLFVELGASKTATSINYAHVVKLIHDETRDSIVNPNQIFAVKRALSKYFNLVSENNNENFAECNKLSYFYLPCNDGKLHPSYETIIVDNHDFRARVKLNELDFGKHIVSNFNDIGIDDGKAISILSRFPEALRPQLMSKVIFEDIELKEENVDSNFVRKLNQKLQCEDFSIALQCIMQQVAQNIQPEQLASDQDTVMTNIIKIRFSACRKVMTKFKFKDAFLDGSSKERKYVMKISDESVVFYIKQTFSGEPLFYESVAKAIFRNLNDYTGDGINLLSKILYYDSEMMLNTLNDMGIPLCKDSLRNFTIVLGSLVPNCYHYLLIQDIFLLWKNQLVALQTDDPMDRDEEGEPTYILVKILEVMNELDEEGNNLEDSYLTKNYKIQCSAYGKDFKIVDASLLFAFRREEANDKNRWEVVLYEGNADEPSQARSAPHGDYRSGIKYIVKKLKEIFKVTDEAQRNRLIKRLMFEFHPDKNPPEKKDLYTKLFQMIPIFMQRLERGDSIDDPAYEEEDATVPDTNKNGAGSFWQNWFNEGFFYNRARRHNNHRRRWRNRRGGRHNYYGYGSTWGGSGGTSSSGGNERANQQSLFRSFVTDESRQPGEAARWMVRAKMDLDSSINDGSTAVFKPSPEWKAYKSYMASQKCLQAAQCAKDYNKTKIKLGDICSDKPHELLPMCTDLDSSHLEFLALQIDDLLSPGGADRLQYPSLHGAQSCCVTEKQADEIQNLAQEIYISCNEYIVQCNDYDD